MAQCIFVLPELRCQLGQPRSQLRCQPIPGRCLVENRPKLLEPRDAEQPPPRPASQTHRKREDRLAAASQVLESAEQKPFVVSGRGEQPRSDATVKSTGPSRRDRPQYGGADQIVSDPQQTSRVQHQPALLQVCRGVLSTNQWPPLDLGNILGEGRTPDDRQHGQHARRVGTHRLHTTGDDRGDIGVTVLTRREHLQPKW